MTIVVLSLQFVVYEPIKERGSIYGTAIITMNKELHLVPVHRSVKSTALTPFSPLDVASTETRVQSFAVRVVSLEVQAPQLVDTCRHK